MGCAGAAEAARCICLLQEAKQQPRCVGGNIFVLQLMCYLSTVQVPASLLPSAQPVPPNLFHRTCPAQPVPHSLAQQHSGTLLLQPYTNH
jgi:hypothetical protein